MTKNDTKIIFVYNANGGAYNSLLDYGKKYITPSKYDCELCMVSYGPFGMKKDWKQFTQKLGSPVVFLHKDEFAKRYTVKTSYPAMIKRTNGKYKVLLDKKDFQKIKTLDDLKQAVNKALAK